MEYSNARLIVTGGSGKTGLWLVRGLREDGHDVLNIDVTGDGGPHGSCIRADLTDPGETRQLISGAAAVVHLAAIPAPGIRSEAETFRINTLSTYNVFAAAADAGIPRVVWASSETVLGLPFDTPPDYAPIDEEAPLRPESSYALSKVLGETMAADFARRSETSFIGLRFSNIMEPEDYDDFAGFSSDVLLRKWNLWGYVDVRDVVESVRLALKSNLTGADAFIIAAADTVMPQDSATLMREVYPGVPIRKELDGRETLLSIDRAREVLGYEPRHGWQEDL